MKNRRHRFSESEIRPGTFGTDVLKGPDDVKYLPKEAKLGSNLGLACDFLAWDGTVADLGTPDEVQKMTWNQFKKLVKSRFLKEGQGEAFLVRGNSAWMTPLSLPEILACLDENLIYEKPKGVNHVCWRKKR